jgi:hypothetical protein
VSSGPGSINRYAPRATTTKTTDAATRAVSSGTSSAMVAAPKSPPVTAPMLQMPWKEFTIERP